MPAAGSSSASVSSAESNFSVQKTPPRELARQSALGALEKQALDIALLDLRGVSTVADYFVLCNGESDLQIKAIRDEIRDRIEEQFEETPWHVEGDDHWRWVVMDYVDTVVHIFRPDKREFYDLERLWGDAPIERVEDGQEGISVPGPSEEGTE